MKKYTTEEKIEFYKNKIKNLENKKNLEFEIQDILRRLSKIEELISKLPR